jgi:DNA-binding response OmpR family regulator
VVVLDLTMPGLTAGLVRRKLTARGQVSAGKLGHGRAMELICLEGPNGLRPRHVGITGGADPHCLTRPFSPRVLVARVHAAIRRSTAQTGHSGTPAGTCTLGGLNLDIKARRASVAGADVGLTATEFALLAFLAGNAGRVVSRQQLLTAAGAAAGGAVSTAGARSVDVHIAQLRAKLGAHSPIRTIRGVGYLAEQRAEQLVT